MNFLFIQTMQGLPRIMHVFSNPQESILMFFKAIYPIQYKPSEGTLIYYSEIEVKINLRQTDYVNEFFRNNLDDKLWVENLVLNPEIADMYTSDIPIFEYPGGLCDPSDHYDYVIVTTTQNGLDYWATGGTIPEISFLSLFL